MPKQEPPKDCCPVCLKLGIPYLDYYRPQHIRDLREWLGKERYGAGGRLLYFRCGHAITMHFAMSAGYVPSGKLLVPEI